MIENVNTKFWDAWKFTRLLSNWSFFLFNCNVLLYLFHYTFDLYFYCNYLYLNVNANLKEIELHSSEIWSHPSLCNSEVILCDYREKRYFARMKFTINTECCVCRSTYTLTCTHLHSGRASLVMQVDKRSVESDVKLPSPGRAGASSRDFISRRRDPWRE